MIWTLKKKKKKSNLLNYDLPAVTEEYRTYSDDVNKFKISIPQGKFFKEHIFVHSR